jgi:hypothetical protein
MIPDCDGPGDRCLRMPAVPDPPWVVSYFILFVLFSKPYRYYKGTTNNHHRRSPDLSRRLLGGGTYAKTLRTMPKRGITYQSGVYLRFDLVDVYSDGSARQPPY